MTHWGRLRPGGSAWLPGWCLGPGPLLRWLSNCQQKKKEKKRKEKRKRIRKEKKRTKAERRLKG
ncbi:hypothetical protein BO70DRAFT_365495 [Aspergillus heteromorphus CBS 117.55]|uniref:Uncharacterized protein n=1 Tax=Aspergillus heteromorphus CBS 117.55 TaxID=1448321 RepID=A0A317V808_9EURO|nr:uncharacterized protein BO70DRAFT_365495 [Aspergillus heteromorphus CBS 117.55]PWY70195.1 hypothetical protein BO70DRAFT_365495 [Aspergillus heteromorphus CBS 117.55]